jgi:hypothetical protein
LAVTTAFGVWQQMQMPEKTFAAVDEYLGAPRNVNIYLDAEMEKVQAATERVQQKV